MTLLDAGIRRFDPVIRHGRRRRAIVGADLEAVLNPFEGTGRDAAAQEQGCARQPYRPQPADKARTTGLEDVLPDRRVHASWSSVSIPFQLSYNRYNR